MTISDGQTARRLAELLGRKLNAVVTVFQQPADDAQGETSGLLEGLPIAVKDIIDIAGHPRGNGNPEAMASDSAQADSQVVATLRAAGADVFAATSLLEYAAGATHPDIPEALNPYDLSRTAGGSSGGSAALVGVGACSAALGTDTGGSIRIPAHYCATVGFKPTFGALPVAGVEPLAPTLDHVGLLCNNVATTVKVFHALTGDQVDGMDETLAGSLRVGVIRGQLTTAELENDVATSVRHTVDALLASGCTIVDVNGPALTAIAQLQSLFSDILLFEAWQVHGSRVTARPTHYGPETLRLLRGAAKVSRDDYEKALAQRQALLPVVASIYDGIDVLLSPACPFVAPATTPPSDTPQGEAEGMFTAIFNLTGDPAIVLPCGWSSDGLPIGVQLSSAFGSDNALLAAAGFVESVLAVAARTPAIR